MNSLPNASELLKKIVEEDPLFKLEVKNKYQEAEELKRWIVLVMKEVNLITEKISELEGFVEIFPVRLQQLSSISIVESSKILSAFKMFFNVLHASIASQARYVKYLARDLEGNFITLIQDECEKLSELKRTYDKGEEKYESCFNRFASSARSREPTHSSSAQEELVQLQEHRYYSFSSIYALFMALCKFQQHTSLVFFSQLFFIANSFSDFCKEQTVIRESLFELSDDLQKNIEKLKLQQESANASFDNQNGFFLKALKVFSQEPTRTVPIDNLSEFKIEKSQVLFVKTSKSWKKAFIRLKHGYLTITWLNTKAMQSSSSNITLQSCSKSQSIPILLAEVRTIGIPNDRKFCFELITPQQSIFFQAETEEAMLDWITCIDAAKQDAIKFTSASPSSLQLSNAGILNQLNDERHSFISSKEFLDGENALAIFSTALQKEIQLNGTAYFTETRLVFYLGIHNNNGMLSILLSEIEFIEMQNFNLYDLVKVTTFSFAHNFKFFNQEGKIFYQILKYLRESCLVKKTGAEVELKIAEIMKNCNQDDANYDYDTRDKSRQSMHALKLSQTNMSTSGWNSVDLSAASVHCGCSTHYENVMTDTIIRFGVDSIFNVWFGKENNFAYKFLNFRSCKDILVGDWVVDSGSTRKSREVNYIMPLDSAFAKQVKCKEIMEIIGEESGTKYIVEIRVKTSDVPYCDYFDTLVRYCLTNASSNGKQVTRVLITASVVWHKWTALKSIILKQTKENMKEIVGKTVFFLIEDLKRKFPEFAAINTSSTYPSESDFGCLADIPENNSGSNSPVLFDSQKYFFHCRIPVKYWWSRLNIAIVSVCFLLIAVLLASRVFMPKPVDNPEPFYFLEKSCRDLFLYENNFLTLSTLTMLAGSKTNSELFEMLRMIKEQRKQSAKNFIRLLKMEKRVTELLYAQNDRELIEQEGQQESNLIASK